MLMTRILFLLAFCLSALHSKTCMADESISFFVSSRKADAIYCSRLNLVTGKMSEPKIAASFVKPDYLALHPNGKILYADHFDKKDGHVISSVNSFKIEGENLVPLNEVKLNGGYCHLAINPGGSALALSNYGGGNFITLPLDQSGQIQDKVSLVQHSGSSIDPKRQEGPHVHQCLFSADQKQLFVTDLGLDKVLVYSWDPEGNKTLREKPETSIAVKPGSGPRHSALSPDGQIIYILQEMGSGISVFKRENESSSYKEIQSISMLPENFKEPNTGSEIVIHPSGKYLYASNRGHHSIAIFRVDQSTGKLESLGHESTLGKTPRHFAISPEGDWLIAENESSGDLFSFKIDPATGLLKASGHSIKIASPICLVFAPTK